MNELPLSSMVLRVRDPLEFVLMPLRVPVVCAWSTLWNLMQDQPALSGAVVEHRRFVG